MKRTDYTPLLLGPIAADGELDLRILARAGGWQTREAKDRSVKQRWLFHGDGSKAARRMVKVLGMKDISMLESFWQKAVQASGPFLKDRIREKQGAATRGTARLKEPEMRGYTPRPSSDLTMEQVKLFELSGGMKDGQGLPAAASPLPS